MPKLDIRSECSSRNCQRSQNDLHKGGYYDTLDDTKTSDNRANKIIDKYSKYIINQDNSSSYESK